MLLFTGREPLGSLTRVIGVRRLDLEDSRADWGGDPTRQLPIYDGDRPGPPAPVKTYLGETTAFAFDQRPDRRLDPGRDVHGAP
jgi:hypothetical protein